MLIGLFFLTESPRWLVKKGRYEEALKSLAYIRNEQIQAPEVVHEMAEIRAAVDEELHLTEGVTWKECIAPGVRSRFITAFVLMLCQQFSGTNSIGYVFSDNIAFRNISNNGIVITPRRSSRLWVSPRRTLHCSRLVCTALSRSSRLASFCTSALTESEDGTRFLVALHGWRL